MRYFPVTHCQVAVLMFLQVWYDCMYIVVFRSDQFVYTH